MPERDDPCRVLTSHKRHFSEIRAQEIATYHTKILHMGDVLPVASLLCSPFRKLGYLQGYRHRISSLKHRNPWYVVRRWCDRLPQKARHGLDLGRSSLVVYAPRQEPLKAAMQAGDTAIDCPLTAGVPSAGFALTEFGSLGLGGRPRTGRCQPTP